MASTEINQIDGEGGGRLSDADRPARPIDQMAKIDRIDGRGDIREHLTRDGQYTICGIEIGYRQPPCGNRPCKRCEKIAARLSETVASGVEGT